MVIKILEIGPEHKAWIRRLLMKHWGGTQILSRGQIHEADRLPGFIAICDDQLSGLVTYHIKNVDCELVSLDSLREGIGIGTNLIEAVKGIARNSGCRRLWLITTNDNTNALRYYQKRGFQITNIYPNAVKKSRNLKPSIPEVGHHGIPIRDEIELEIHL
jgi:GNAT superfamily N-acetyltransferase